MATLLSDGAGAGTTFTLAGFVKSNGNEAKDHYYLAGGATTPGTRDWPTSTWPTS